MKKLIIGLILSVCSVSIFAAPVTESSQAVISQLVQANNTLTQVYEALLKSHQPRDAKAFCYHEDKVYSEGGKLNGLTCRRRGSADIFDKNKQTYPLFWETDVKAINQ